MSIPNILTIAGSDSGGGAGVQADLKAISALGGYGASVITAITAQNTVAVTAIHDVPPEVIAAQLDAVLSDLDIAAVKIGMLSQPAVIEVVAEKLTEYAPGPVVLDPVMVAKSGDALLAEEAVTALKERLIPLATVLTPNLPEAEVLLDAPTREPLADYARGLLALGPQYALLKGGHGEGSLLSDHLVSASGAWRFDSTRIATQNTHGTGCTLSSAIAAKIALGLPIPEAVQAAIDYLHAAIARADSLSVGHGHGPVHHFHPCW